MRESSESRAWPGADLLDGGPQAHLHAVALEHRRGVGVGVLREWPEHGVAVVDHHHLRRRGVQVRELDRHRVRDHLRERPGDLGPGGPGADDDEGEGPLLDQAGLALHRVEDVDDLGAQPVGVVDRVEREGVLLGPGGLEEARPRAGRQHQRVAGEAAPVLGRDRPLRGVHGCGLGDHHLHVGMGVEQLVQGEGDVGARQLRRRHLVEQRLELVVVVPVDQGDVDVLVLGEGARAAQAGEPAAHDDHVVTHPTTSARSASGPARSSRSARSWAVLIRPRWLNAWGKLPSCSPVGPISSE